MSRLVAIALIGSSMVLTPAEAATPAPAKRAVAAADRCALQPIGITIDASSFRSVPGVNRPGAEAGLKAAFATIFAATFKDLCQRKRITPAAFRGVSRIQLINAEGDTDGHFLKADTPRGPTTFEYLFDAMKAPPRAAIVNGLECLAHPKAACFED